MNAGFSNGNRVFGGGEAGLCVEDFDHTKLYNLHYLKKVGSLFYFYNWEGYEKNYHDDSPYYNTGGGSNALYDDP